MKSNSGTAAKKPLLTRIAEQLLKDQQELDHLAVQLSLGKAEARDKFEELKKNLIKNVESFKADLQKEYKDNKEWAQSMKDKLNHLEEQLSASKSESKEVYEAQKKNILNALSLVKEEIKKNPEVQKMSDFFTAASEKAKLQMKLFEMKWGTKEKALTEFRNEMKKASVKVDELLEDVKNSKAKAENKIAGFNKEIHSAYDHFKKAIKSL